MLRENDRIAWRYKDNRDYVDGFVREINGKMIQIITTQFKTELWLNREEIEIEILKRTD